jgi:hypothetical protein
MSTSKAPVAQYPFSQAALWQRCLDLFPSLDRDQVLLKEYGVTAGIIQKFKDDTKRFGEMDPDTVVQQEGAVVTVEKNADELALEGAIQRVLGRVALKDRPTTARYKRMGVEAVTNLTEAELHLAATMVVKQGRKYLLEYKDQGLTEKLLQEVEDLDKAFVEGLGERKSAENTRSEATDARIEFANGLYEQLVQLGLTGSTMWEEKGNATKRDEYIIDASAAPESVKPTT